MGFPIALQINKSIHVAGAPTSGQATFLPLYQRNRTLADGLVSAFSR
jgi:hypothetical protein